MSEEQKTDAAPSTAVAVAVPPPKAELVAGNNVAPIIPRTIDEVARVASAIIKAGLAPDSYRSGDPQETASRIIVGIMKGAEVGFPPITALSTIAIISGRPCIYGDGAVALAQSRNLIEKFEQRFDGEDGTDNYTCHVLIWRRGQENPYEGHFSLGDAKRARLLNKPGPWLQYPTRMMFNRARAFALRDGFADCLCGLAIAEEIRDLPPELPKPATDFLEDDDAPQAAQQQTASEAAA